MGFVQEKEDAKKLPKTRRHRNPSFGLQILAFPHAMCDVSIYVEQ